jgi:hypothetical protein
MVPFPNHCEGAHSCLQIYTFKAFYQVFLFVQQKFELQRTYTVQKPIRIIGSSLNENPERLIQNNR